MNTGRAPGRRLALGTAIAVTTFTLAACYQSIWKADFTTPVANARNYSITSATDSAGNLLVGGASTVAITQDATGNEIAHFQPSLLKYDASGKLLWTFHFDNGRRRTTPLPASEYYINEYTGGAEISQVVTTATGDIFAAGIVPGVNYATDAADYDLALFKLNSAGELQWSRIIQRPSQDSPMALGLSASGNLLLGVGHLAEWNSSTEALSVSAVDGTTLWSDEQADEENAPILYSYAEAVFARTTNAITSPHRIAISHDWSRIRVYDESGQIVSQFPQQVVSGNNQGSSNSSGPDIAPACSGDVGGVDLVLGMTFDGDDLLVTQGNMVVGCGFAFSGLTLLKLDASGATAWSAQLYDPTAGETGAEYEAYLNGERTSFFPFSIPLLHQDAIMTSDADTIYVATNVITDFHTKVLGEAAASDVDSQIFAVEKNGQVRWMHTFGSTPLVTLDTDSGDTEADVKATWITARDMTLTAQGKPVIALNEISTDGLTYYYANLRHSTFAGARSRLAEFDPVTGKLDSFGTENDQLVRSVSPGKNKGVFKVGDNHYHVPAWWMMNPTGVSSTASAIHISHYRPR